MKNLFLTFFLAITFISYSQVNRYSKPIQPARYNPSSFEELSRLPMELQKRYNHNQDYLYALQSWILELKPQIKEQTFINRLNGELSVLKSMENDDLARATNILKQREISIKNVISEYNTFVSNQNATQQNNNSQQNQNNNTNTEINYYKIGYEYHQKGDFSKAIYNYSKYLESDKNNTDVIFLRGWAKSELNDNYGAISDYDKIFELQSNYPLKMADIATVYNNKAYSLVKMKKYNEALPLVNIALEKNNSMWYIWDTRAEIHLNMGNFKEAINDATKAIQIDPNSNSYLVRGLAYIKNKEKDLGCKDLSKAGELGESKAYDEISKYCN
ncbi:MAG TPA: tetratricopeptide repeat protein [Lutibacter sp.]